MNESAPNRAKRKRKHIASAQPQPDLAPSGSGAVAAPQRGRWGLVAGLVAIAAVAVGVARLTRESSAAVPPPPPPPMTAIVGIPATLSAATDVRVYWRAVPEGNSFAAGQPYVESFQVLTSANETGRGAVTGEQIFVRVEHLALGKVVKAWIRDARPGEPMETAGRVPLLDGADDYAGWIRTAQDGMPVLLVDLETGPAEPEPEPDCVEE